MSLGQLRVFYSDRLVDAMLCEESCVFTNLRESFVNVLLARVLVNEIVWLDFVFLYATSLSL